MQLFGNEAQNREVHSSDPFNPNPIEVASALDLYRSSLLSGDAALAADCIDQALSFGLSPTQVYLSVLMPAQLEIAKLWSDSKLGVCEEHRATQITLNEMARLRFLFKPLNHLGVKAVVSSVDGEDHFIGARMIADFLLMDGWDVHFLGAKTPAGDLVNFIENNKFNLIILAATTLESLPVLKETINKLKKSPNLPKIMVGGEAINNNIEKVSSFKPDAIALNAEETIAFARKLCGIGAEDTTLARYLKTLGDRIMGIRKVKKFSQQKLAERAKLDRAYISSVENGKQNVTVGAVVKLAHALEIPLDELLVGK